jgi:hypothetical protein
MPAPIKAKWTTTIRRLALRTFNSAYFAIQMRPRLIKTANTPVFIVVTPNIVHLASRSALTLPKGIEPFFILNGVDEVDFSWLKKAHPIAHYITLKTSITGRHHNLVSHGEVIDLIARNCEKEFCLMDADNFLIDPDLFFEMQNLTSKEFASGPFIKDHDKNGNIIPETFLVTINSQHFRQLRGQIGLSAVVTKCPKPSVSSILAQAGFTNGEYPEQQNDFWDTLQIYWCISHHHGFRFRQIENEPEKSIHIGGTSYLTQIGDDISRWNFLPLAVHYLNLRLMELPEMHPFAKRFQHLRNRYESASNLLSMYPDFKKTKRFRDVNLVVESNFKTSNRSNS